ncbi:MAG TPA: hypothetical protein VN046_02105 [Stenotrophobium sp.]|nr:hypothetical protein [Stenotrophobium sp.]
MQADSQIGPHLERQGLGMAGFSMGGIAVLLSDETRFDIDHFIRFCRSHDADATRVPQAEAPDQTMAAREQALKASQMVALAKHAAAADYAIPGLRAVFMMAPSEIEALAPTSLRSPGTPVSMVLGGAVRWRHRLAIANLPRPCCLMPP